MKTKQVVIKASTGEILSSELTPADEKAIAVNYTLAMLRARLPGATVRYIGKMETQSDKPTGEEEKRWAV